MIKDLEQSEELKCYLNAFAASPRGFILLSGTNGSGKSYASLEAYNAFTPYRLPYYDHDLAWFITQAELNLRWQKEVMVDRSAFQLFENLSKTKLLVLDDVGTRIPTDSFMDFLYLIVDQRSINKDKVGTIITTNLNQTQMREMFGDAFVSRVASGRCFRLEGNDRRFNKTT